MNIINSSASMKAKPSELSSLETECLFGETVKILDDHFDWVYCKLSTDNYQGWVKKENLGNFRKSTHRVITKRSFIYANKNPKSNCLFYLPMGSRLLIDNIKSDWAEVILHSPNPSFGFVPSNHIVNINHTVKDWVKSAQKLMGTPYKWGGRDTIGIDCSALLQLSYQTYGENIPRNTSEQIKLNKKPINNLNDLKRGCVVFWKGHVGIMINKVNCIHANAHHMKTITEPLFDIIKRTSEDNQIVKMMDFN